MRPLLAILLALSCAGCITESKDLVVGMEMGAPTFADPVKAWEVVENGEVVGRVVIFQVRDEEERFFQIRNVHHQDLGMVDSEGRWWRYDLHSDQPVWLGTGTVRGGICQILGAGLDAPFYEVPLDTLADEAREASATPSHF